MSKMSRRELLEVATALAAACTTTTALRGATAVHVPIEPCVNLAAQLIQAVDKEMEKR